MTDSGAASRGSTYSRRAVARRQTDGDRSPRPSDAEALLLQRVVVMPGDRAAELAEGLAAEGLGVRVWVGSVEELADFTTGLVVFDLRDGGDDVIAGLMALRAKRAYVAAVAVGEPASGESAGLLRAAVDAVLPAQASAALIAAQLCALARLMALPPVTAERGAITFRNLTIDLARRQVRAGGRVVPLTPTEFRILAQLARRPGQVVTHAEIFREVHGYEASELDAKNILKVHVWRLRSKLAEAAPGQSPIVNVRGFGYMLERRASRSRRPRASEGR